MTGLFNALIRTHHITSRKKVAKLKHAARLHNVNALLRSGGAPGIMYVQGHEQSVRAWVATVQNLRYKDYQLVSRIAPVITEGDVDKTIFGPINITGQLLEISSVKDFGHEMKLRGIYQWWRNAMGYSTVDP